MRTMIWFKSSVILWMLQAVFFSAISFANDQHEHGADDTMSDHMQAMYALKDEVPEEYSIMERTPISPDKDSLQRGEKLYQQQCAVCHGQNGRGDGPAASGMQSKPANFLDLEHSRIYGPGEKYWIVGNGSGATGMPAFSQISPADRWHLVNYILDLQKVTDDHSGHDHSH